MTLSFENSLVGADVFVGTEGNTVTLSRPGVTGPPESETRARTIGFPRNLGDPCVSAKERRLVRTLLKRTWPPSNVAARHGGAKKEHPAVWEGVVTQADPDEHKGVGALHSTDETGELLSRGPSGGKGEAVNWNVWRER